MKKIFFIQVCMLLLLRAASQNITNAEYFFDTDPGKGNGNALSVGSPGTTVNFTSSISTASLSVGFHNLCVRTEDANGIWSLFESRVFYIATATVDAASISSAEYFIDADPGVGNGTSISIGAPGSTVNFVASIPVTSLTAGFHSLNIRTRDANNIWSLYETRGFYIAAATANAATVVSAEYFIDGDPGVGNGTAVSVGSSGNTVNFIVTTPTTSLAAGFHTVSIRTKDAANVWSLYESRGFYISTTTTNAAAITAAEYFIDSDPGVGNGSTVAIGSSGNTVNFTASIPTTSLSPGFHTLAIRTKNADNVWGFYEARGFYIATAAVDAAAVGAAEFFFDNDPGPGNGTTASIGSSGNTVSFTALLPVGSLANGFHTLAIRTRSTDNVWSLYETRAFYISTATGNMGVVAAAEYFIDTDPGPGNGSALTVNSPGPVVNQTFLCNVPGGTANGNHVIGIRTRDANGVWSLFEIDTFAVAGALPLHWLSFTGRKLSDKIELKWTTENEVNTSHFEIERSRNGVDFTGIGTVTALGQSRNEYLFNDLQPLNGVNFYRLKQVDIDNRFEYSVIVKILWGELKNDLHVYPNPASDKLNIDFNGRGNVVLINIYDATGRFVMATRQTTVNGLVVPVTGLSSGTYWITVSDGASMQAGKFIKK